MKDRANRTIAWIGGLSLFVFFLVIFPILFHELFPGT